MMLAIQKLPTSFIEYGVDEVVEADGGSSPKPTGGASSGRVRAANAPTSRVI